MRNVLFGIFALALVGCGGSISHPSIPPSAGQDQDLGNEIRRTQQWVWSDEYLGNLIGIGLRSHAPLLIETGGSNLTLEIQLRVPKASAQEKIDQFLNQSLSASKLEAKSPFFVAAQTPGTILESITLRLPESRKDLELTFEVSNDLRMTRVEAQSISFRPTGNALIRTIATKGLMSFEGASNQILHTAAVLQHAGDLVVGMGYVTTELFIYKITGHVVVQSCDFTFGTIRIDGQPIDVPTCSKTTPF